MVLLAGCTTILAVRALPNTKAGCEYRGGKWFKIKGGHRCLDEHGEYR